MVFYLLGTAATKDRLRAVLGMLDPLVLLDEIRAVQHHLAALAAGATVHPMPERDADLDGFLRSLALACAPARCGRHIGLARDHPNTGVPGRIRSRRHGPESSGGWKPSRIGLRRSSSTASAGNSPGGVPPRPASNSAAPRPRPAAPGRPSSPLRLSDGINPERLRVADPSRRAERDRFGRGQAPPGCRSDPSGRSPQRRRSRTPRLTALWSRFLQPTTRVRSF